MWCTRGHGVCLHSFKRSINMPSKSILLFRIGRSIWCSNRGGNSTDVLFIHEHTVLSSCSNQGATTYLVLTSHSLGALWFFCYLIPIDIAQQFELNQHLNVCKSRPLFKSMVTELSCLTLKRNNCVKRISEHVCPVEGQGIALVPGLSGGTWAPVPEWSQGSPR